MNEDWHVATLARIEIAATALRDSLAQLGLTLDQARDQRSAGVGLVDIVTGLNRRGGSDFHLAPTRAFRVFEHAMTAYRAAVVRSLIDDQHMTFSDVGELTSISRQMVARLYRLDLGSDPAEPASFN